MGLGRYRKTANIPLKGEKRTKLRKHDINIRKYFSSILFQNFFKSSLLAEIEALKLGNKASFFISITYEHKLQMLTISQCNGFLSFAYMQKQNPVIGALMRQQKVSVETARKNL